VIIIDEVFLYYILSLYEVLFILFSCISIYSSKLFIKALAKKYFAKESG